MYNDALFNAFARTYEARSEVDMSMADYLESCRGDPMRYANAAERLLAAIGEPELIDTAKDTRLGRIFLNRTIRRYPAFANFYGMEETIERIVAFFRHAAQGLEERKQILYLLGPGRRRQVVTGRAAEVADGGAPDLRAEGRRRIEPGVRKPAQPVRSRHARTDDRGEVRHSAPASDGIDEPVVLQAARGVRRRHLALPRRAHPAVAAAADRGRQDRARRREQPGHLLAGRQGRYPQARDLRAERSGRVQLLRRLEPRQPGHPRIRRDVQGADQDAASASDRDAGRQLHRHREYRRDPVQRRYPRPLERSRVARASRPTRTTRPSSTASA